MKIEILSDVMISGEPAPAGSTVDVSRADALLLISLNKAQLIPEPPSDDAAQPTEAAQPASAAPKRSRKPEPSPEAEQ